MTQIRKKFSGFALELDVAKKIAHQLARLPASSHERVYHFAVGAIKRGEDFDRLAKDLPNGAASLDVAGQTHLSDLE